MRDAPHCHEAAVGMADQPQALAIDGRHFLRRINASQDVAPVATAKVRHVSARKCLALAEAAAWIGQEDKITFLRELAYLRAGVHVTWRGCRTGAAMHIDDHRILLARFHFHWP